MAGAPSYVQSLMSKIVSNISIVCNNAIFKVESERQRDTAASI